jgi:hypothetical protein
MKSIIRYITAVIAGLVSGSIVNMGIILISGYIMVYYTRFICSLFANELFSSKVDYDGKNYIQNNRIGLRGITSHTNCG